VGPPDSRFLVRHRRDHDSRGLQSVYRLALPFFQVSAACGGVSASLSRVCLPEQCLADSVMHAIKRKNSIPIALHRHLKHRPQEIEACLITRPFDLVSCELMDPLLVMSVATAGYQAVSTFNT
jgi:hypothetical protein